MTFIKDLIERAGKTFLQFFAVLSALVTTFPAEDVREALEQLALTDRVGIAFAGAVLSIAMSWLSRYRGSKESASLIDTAPQIPEKPDPPGGN